MGWGHRADPAGADTGRCSPLEGAVCISVLAPPPAQRAEPPVVVTGKRWLTPLVSWKACSSYSSWRFSFSLLERAIMAGLIMYGPRAPKSFADLPRRESRCEKAMVSCLHLDPILMTKVLYGPRIQSAKGPEQPCLCLLLLCLVRCQSLQSPVPPSTHLFYLSYSQTVLPSWVSVLLGDISLYKDFCPVPPTQRTVWGTLLQRAHTTDNTPRLLGLSPVSTWCGEIGNAGVCMYPAEALGWKSGMVESTGVWREGRNCHSNTYLCPKTNPS